MFFSLVTNSSTTLNKVFVFSTALLGFEGDAALILISVCGKQHVKTMTLSSTLKITMAERIECYTLETKGTDPRRTVS